MFSIANQLPTDPSLVHRCAQYHLRRSFRLVWFPLMYFFDRQRVISYVLIFESIHSLQDKGFEAYWANVVLVECILLCLL